MKKILTFLLALALCVGLCACGAGKVEGRGYGSPEEAVLAYAEALQAGDVKKILKTFAIETYVDNYDLEKGVERVRGYSKISEELPLAGDSYSRDVNLINRQAVIIRNLKFLYLGVALEWDEESIISLAGGGYADAEDLVDALTLDDWSGILADMRFDDDFIYLDDILEEGPAERSEEVLKENRKTYGCEKIETLALEVELDGEDLYLCMDAACYDGKWYCLNQGGMIGSLMGVPVIHGGVAPD